MSSPPRPIVEADIHAFVDGQMDFDRRAAFAQAMAVDPDLRAKVELWRRQNEALTATFGGVLREPVPARLMATNLGRERGRTVSDSQALQTPEPKASPLASSGVTSGSTRLAIVVLAAFVGGGAFALGAEALWVGDLPSVGRITDGISPVGTRALALRAYEAHRTYATDLNHAVEVPASDEAYLLKWIQHRLSMAIRIPDLRREGWTLIGGRVLPGELGPAAFLIYGDGVERLGLYIARTNTHQGDTLSVFDNGAGLGSVAYWVDEPVGYAITTNRDTAWLERSGAALYQSIRAQARDNASAE